jgi:hypothetical protein
VQKNQVLLRQQARGCGRLRVDVLDLCVLCLFRQFRDWCRTWWVIKPTLIIELVWTLVCLYKVLIAKEQRAKCFRRVADPNPPPPARCKCCDGEGDGVNTTHGWLIFPCILGIVMNAVLLLVMYEKKGKLELEDPPSNIGRGTSRPSSTSSTEERVVITAACVIIENVLAVILFTHLRRKHYLCYRRDGFPGVGAAPSDSPVGGACCFSWSCLCSVFLALLLLSRRFASLLSAHIATLTRKLCKLYAICKHLLYKRAGAAGDGDQRAL